jgi:hypothetical protein
MAHCVALNTECRNANYSWDLHPTKVSVFLPGSQLNFRETALG